ncbi:hypothetical protein L2E82_51650 [Cichorium intybus]|nr:hypothetical protein L2E82_51650 [Cichorium intybus]
MQLRCLKPPFLTAIIAHHYCRFLSFTPLLMIQDWWILDPRLSHNEPILVMVFSTSAPYSRTKRWIRYAIRNSIKGDCDIFQYYDQQLVLQQLKCCGVLEVVRISRSGFPTRMTHQKFTRSSLLGMVSDTRLDLEMELALGFLDHLLLGTPASPLTKILLESGLGDAIVCGGMEDETLIMNTL